MTRFKKIDGTLCLSVEALTCTMGIGFEQALNTIKKGLARNRKGRSSWQHYIDSDDNRRKWIVYKTIPETTRLRVDNHYGDVRLAYWSEQLMIEALGRVLPEDKAHYLKLEALEESKCTQLAEACGWMRLVVSDYWRGKWSGRTVFFDWAAKAIEPRKLYGLKVSSGSSLRRKVKAWNEHGRAALVPRHLGNTNAAKITQEAIDRLIDLYGSPLKPTYRSVAKVYNREAAGYGWANLSEERIRQILSMPKYVSIWSLARHGVEATRNNYEATLRRKRASFPDALWSMDGTTVQLYYAENGQKRKSELYIYAVIDAYSDAVIGYALHEGRGEPSTIVQAALRDTTRKTGMRPFQLQYDNSSANKSSEAQQLFKKLARVGFPTAPYNGKSKPIEAIFGRIEQGNMRLLPNFKGGNITTRSLDSKANPDFILQQEKDGTLPTKEQVIAQVKLVIEIHNHSEWRKDRSTTRIERYRTAHEKRKPMDYLTQVSLFWVERKHKVQYTKDGIRMQVNREQYHYTVESKRGIECRDFRNNHLGDRFTVKYDPDDLEYINLYQEGKWIATAVQKYEYAMAKADAVSGEGRILSEALELRKEDIRAAARKMQRIQEDQRNAGRPVLDHQLVHKEAYNRMQEEYLDELLEATGQVVKTAPPKKRKRYSMYDDSDAEGQRIL